MPDGVLVRFGEIGIKSAPVRRAMVRTLRNNLLDGLVRHGMEGDVLTVGTRLWMSGPDVEGLKRVAQATFGVVSASPATVAPGTIAGISEAAIQLALAAPWDTFAVRARREGTHDFSSMDAQRQVGSAIFVAAQGAGRQPRVELGAPQFELFVDIRQDRAYLFTEHAEGPGGIPLGTQGRVLAALGTPDDALAAWLMMRRGCEVVALDAGAPPGLVAHMVRLGMDAHVEPPAPAGADAAEHAAGVAKRRKAIALVSGVSLAELFAGKLGATTQSGHNPHAASPHPEPSAAISSPVAESGEVPVLRPLLGLAPAVAHSLRRLAGLDQLAPPRELPGRAA